MELANLVRSGNSKFMRLHFDNKVRPGQSAPSYSYRKVRILDTSESQAEGRIIREKRKTRQLEQSTAQCLVGFLSQDWRLA